jgi:hypothetical protein
MTHDWRPEIVRMVQIKQAIADADPKHSWQYTLPGVAATAEALKSVEEALGFELEPGYWEFLGYANGWRAFMLEIDLFGVDDLAGGPRMVAARRLAEALEPVALKEAGLLGARLVPIGGSDVDRDLFLMQVVDGRQVAPVLWFSGGEVDRYETFQDFVLAMIEYNAEDLAELTGS